MREASQAPRNGRELAVRNQFFTPRYVVEFLVDNTLGRMWIEMHGEGTALVERCRYFVRTEGMQARARKDPRDLKVLDPACGSGHFLLYAFDVLLVIYEEAWAAEGQPRSEATGRTLREDYGSIEGLRRAVPALVLEHNLHGVDIDPRAAQIAALALWMRAQRAWREAGVAAVERPRVRRTHIVIAEPMPGDAALVQEFAAKLEPPLLRDLFRRMVEEMHLAGEMGTLLPVEDGIASALEVARTKFAELYMEPHLPGLDLGPRQGLLDLSGIDDGSFFLEAEGRILEASRRYAVLATGREGTRRRLFADDAEQGLALIELLRTRYDVVLMNPPFGETTSLTRTAIKTAYGQSSNDMFAAFVARGLQLRARHGLLGAITSRTGFFASSLNEWRSGVYQDRLYLLADLGERVMDAATVDAAAYCIGAAIPLVVFRLLTAPDKEASLQRAVQCASSATPHSDIYWPSLPVIQSIRNAPFAYWVPASVIHNLARWPEFERPGGASVGAVRKGLRTGDNFRFVRAYWEVARGDIETNGTDVEAASGWVPLVMTGVSQPWFAPIFLVLNWKLAGRELRAFVLKHGAESRLIQARDFYFRPGFSWTLRAVRLFPYSVPAGCIFTGSRPMAFADERLGSRAALALFASRAVSSFIRWYAEKFAWPKFAEGHLKNVPIPTLGEHLQTQLEAATDEGVAHARERYRHYEPFLEFVAPCVELDDTTCEPLSFDPNSLLPTVLEDQIAAALGLSPTEAVSLYRDLDEALAFAAGRPQDEEDEDDDASDNAVVLVDNPVERAWRLLSYCVGCLFGRWDIRLATGERPIPSHAPADAPLPRSPVATFDETEAWPSGLSAGHPLGTTHSFLVDDPGHPADVNRRVSEVLAYLGIDRLTLLHLLARRGDDFDPRVWREFAQVHTRMYTLGRRKAPIYWQLAPPSGTYSVWLYAQDVTRDTFFQIREVVVLKLAHEEGRLVELVGAAGSSASMRDRKDIAAQQTFVQELHVFLDELKRVAPLWNPNLDDGVVLVMAPLWRLVPQHRAWQKELRTHWDALVAGKYDWAHIAMHLWPERVVPKCATDRSFAIAHGLEDVFWAEGADGKWKPRPAPTTPIETLVAERTSPAVKAALQSLLDAPAPAGRTRKSGGA